MRNLYEGQSSLYLPHFNSSAMSYTNCHSFSGIRDVAFTLINSLDIVEGNTRDIIMEHPKS